MYCSSCTLVYTARLDLKCCFDWKSSQGYAGRHVFWHRPIVNWCRVAVYTTLNKDIIKTDVAKYGWCLPSLEQKTTATIRTTTTTTTTTTTEALSGFVEDNMELSSKNLYRRGGSSYLRWVGMSNLVVFRFSRSWGGWCCFVWNVVVY